MKEVTWSEKLKRTNGMIASCIKIIPLENTDGFNVEFVGEFSKGIKRITFQSQGNGTDKYDIKTIEKIAACLEILIDGANNSDFFDLMNKHNVPYSYDLK